MINASELRLGNWVLYGNTYVQVNSISNHAINHHMYEENNAYTFSISFGNLEPVLLTEEIFERAGFKILGGSWYELDLFEGSRKLSISIIESGWAIGDDDYARELVFKGVPYLHKLQNLYWCICSEELKINL